MANTDLAQKTLENTGQKSFLFKYIETELAKRSDSLTKSLNIIKERLFNSLTKDEYELLGMFSFLMGYDYTSQAYPQKNILENVQKRFTELNVTDEQINIYFDIMKKINDEFKGNKEILNSLFNEAEQSMKNNYTSVITVPNDKKIELKLIKSNLNKFLDVIQIPIGFSNTVTDFKKNDLTYETLLKANDVINNQGTYLGSYVKKFTELYGNKFFIELLNKAGKYFNETKFSLIYNEAILSVLESINRFELCVNPSNYSDEQYSSFKEKYEKEQEQRLAELKEKDKEEIQAPIEKPQYTSEDIKRLMTEAPDEFVVLNLLETINKNQFDSDVDVITAIDNLIEKSDYLEHLFTYIKKNQDNPYRCIGATAINNISIETIIEALNNIIAIEGEEYKQLAEINCAEIPAEFKDKIISYVNDTIKGCILQTPDQKQYLISQLMENGISTWNHLQQIMTILETCNIYGESASSYTTLYNFIEEKTIIKEVFDAAEKMNNIQTKLSVYNAFRTWFKFHLPKNTSEE